MVELKILVRIHPEKRTEFLLAFDMLKTVNQQDDSRLGLELFEQVNEPNTFLWIEQWASKDSLDGYFEDNSYRVMMGAIDILGQLVHKRTLLIQQ